jgi:dTDP-4-dehydrorhamnose reductase
MSDVLVLGANGQVGHELPRALARLGSVLALGRSAADLADPESLRAVVRAHRPRVIVNAAAYTAVDRAEREPDLAASINAVAPGVLAEEAEALGAMLVQYSTDYVFSGRKPLDAAYEEDDATGPLSTYGRTKLEGERAARACRRHLVLRTSWVAGTHGTNFARTMMRLAAERDALRVVADQHGAPTTAELIAERTAEVLHEMRDAPAGDERWGTYHLVASGQTTWHGYARRVVARGHAAGMALKCRPEDVQAITTAEYPTPAARPANSRLDTAKLRRTFPGVSLPPWEAGVDRLVDHLIREQSR